MMIVRVSSLKPRIVVFHKTMPDEEAIRIAEYEQIPIIYSSAPTLRAACYVTPKTVSHCIASEIGEEACTTPAKNKRLDSTFTLICSLLFY